ncbi:MAG TPA: Hsp20/alpha crystallin family protein [Thermohalobaculum sp.]|nr:Hsp20/alpha crystallin family protein [Thermohalobaculum sp.]
MSTEMSQTARTPEKTGQSAAEQGETARGAAVFRPLADIREHKDGVTVTVEMPGVGPDDVEIELERRVLTIRGRGRRTAPEGYRRVYAEYEEGDYERTFTVSEDLDAAKVKASMKSGVLTLELPRAKEAKPRQIKVSAA